MKSRADTLVRFAAGSPENGLFCQNGPFFGLFLPPKVLFHTWNMQVKYTIGIVSPREIYLSKENNFQKLVLLFDSQISIELN